MSDATAARRNEIGDDEPVRLADAVTMAHEVAEALRGHVLDPGSLRDKQRVQYLEGRDIIDAELANAVTPQNWYSAFANAKKPGDYRYRDIAAYHLATYRAFAVLDALRDIIEKEQAEEDRRLALAAPAPPPGWVYFIESGGRVKIGFTSNVAARIANIETATPFPVTLLRQQPGSLDDEAAFHAQFAEYRIKREWFRFEGALKEFLDGGDGAAP